MTGSWASPGDAFAAGLRDGIIRVEQCRACGFEQSLDPMSCANCGSQDLIWIENAGGGRVDAVTHVHRAPTPAFRELQPYTLVLVTLAGGSRIMGHGMPDLAIGDRVLAQIFRHDGCPIIRFMKENA